MDYDYLFIGGLHRSGTSLLHACLKSHEKATGFANTGAPEDEGQHLQDVYKPAYEHGGPGRFAFDKAAHLTERSALAVQENRVKLLASWEQHWEAGKPLRIEKSPPNLIRSRFLHALFPEAKFLFIVRHPLAVTFATQKWSKTTPRELMKHWQVAHQTLFEDVKHLPKGSYRFVNFERFIVEPGRLLSGIHNWLGLRHERVETFVDPRANDRYYRLWEEYRGKHRIRSAALAWSNCSVKRFGYHFNAPYYKASGLQLGENWLS